MPIRPKLRPASPIAQALDDALRQAIDPTSASSGQALSAEERKAFMDDVRRCWNVPPSASSELETTVVIAFSMTQDGKPIASSIRLVSSESGSSTSTKIAFQSAKRAILVCGLLGFQLPGDKYDQWKDIELTFNDEDMRRD